MPTYLVQNGIDIQFKQLTDILRQPNNIDHNNSINTFFHRRLRTINKYSITLASNDKSRRIGEVIQSQGHLKAMANHPTNMAFVVEQSTLNLVKYFGANMYLVIEHIFITR